MIPMCTNKKIRPPLSDGERISRLEQKTKIQSVAIFLLAVNVLVLSWRMYSLIRLNSDSLLLVTQSIQSVSDHVTVIDQQIESICNMLEKMVALFG